METGCFSETSVSTYESKHHHPYRRENLTFPFQFRFIFRTASALSTFRPLFFSQLSCSSSLHLPIPPLSRHQRVLDVDNTCVLSRVIKFMDVIIDA